jgi:hypothetical protein
MPVPVTPSVALPPVETVAGEALATKLEIGVQGEAFTVTETIELILQVPVPFVLLTVTL